MRRPIPIALLAAALLAAAAAAPPAPAGQAPASSPPAPSKPPVPPAFARTTQCLTGPAKADRSATFTGDVRAVPGASRLQIRFVLQARAGDAKRWSSVAAPGFGTWNTSDPGIGRYVYTKTVHELLAPATYRVLVHFRWLDGKGRTILRARRTTRACRQPDLRPDLAPERLERRGDGWEVTVANVGRTAAGAFTVTVETNGQVFELGRVERLAARERLRVAGPAPACRAGEPVTVRVDAAGAVDEVDEDANALVRPCPEPVSE